MSASALRDQQRTPAMEGGNASGLALHLEALVLLVLLRDDLRELALRHLAGRLALRRQPRTARGAGKLAQRQKLCRVQTILLDTTYSRMYIMTLFGAAKLVEPRLV